MVKNLQNFLLDQDYYIDIYSNFLHVFNYSDLITLTSKLIELKVKEFRLVIEGDNLTVSALDKQEILIKGLILNVRFIR